MATPNSTADHRHNGHQADDQPSAAVQTPEPTESKETSTPEAEADNAGAKDPQAKSKARRPPLLLLILAGVGLIVGGIFGYRWWAYASTHETTNDAQLQGHVYPISSRISGTVQQVAVEDNQQVTAHQLLVKLDPHDYEAKVQQAQAALATAQKQAEAAKASVVQAGANAQAQATSAQGAIAGASAAIADARAALESARAQVPVAQAELVKAEATLQKNATDYERYQTLYQQGAISAQDRDAAKQAYEVARAQRLQAREQVQQAQAQVAQAQEGVSKAQAQLQTSRGSLQQAQASGVQTAVNKNQYEAAIAQIAQAEANLKEAHLQLGYTTITAPATGTVGNKTVEAGQQVQTGQPLMAVVGNDLWVVANFKETQIDHMRAGEPVEIDVDALPDHPFSGHVVSLSPASGSQFALLPPDNATGNFTKVVQRIPVKISLDRESLVGYETKLGPGMSVTVSVDTTATAPTNPMAQE